MILFDGESQPVAIDPILRGVDLAVERLVQRDCFTERTLSVLDELRAEVINRSPSALAPYPTPDHTDGGHDA